MAETTFGSLNPVYEHVGDKVEMRLPFLSGSPSQRLAPMGPDIAQDPEVAWHHSRLRGIRPEPKEGRSPTVRVLDLFSGAGGFGLGIKWAIEAAGATARTVLASDINEAALDVHAYNLNPRRSLVRSVRELLRIEPLVQAGEWGGILPSELVMPLWPRSIREADIVIGGPPCQGHSNLNNHTRRKDHRNELYIWMAAAAVVTRPKLVVIENVPTVMVDAGEVVSRTAGILQSSGYETRFEGVLRADHFGVGQTRKRHFLIAVRNDVLDESGSQVAVEWLSTKPSMKMTVLDAIADLSDTSGESDFDRPADLSSDNILRVNWLHEQGEHDLPDDLRPECHRDGHTYDSVYGRMHANRPAPTLSRGFLSPGRGRYVHPTKPRSLTPHEGARIQGFPDDFRFLGASGMAPTRTQVADMIGEAVPPPLAFHVGIAALAMLRPGSLVS